MYIYTCKHTQTHIHLHTQTHTQINTVTQMHTNAHTHTKTHIHSCTHTVSHTHTHAPGQGGLSTFPLGLPTPVFLFLSPGLPLPSLDALIAL